MSEKIVTDQNVLRQKSKETTLEECEKTGLFRALEHLLATNNTPGIGLAAIQAGYPIRACFLRIPAKDGDARVYRMINPVIEDRHELRRFIGEQCLSLPGVKVDTERYNQVTVKWFDYDYKTEMRAVATGLEAQAIQHEIDHMDGILITDLARPKLGRNDPCFCGSGKKFKKCHGR